MPQESNSSDSQTQITPEASPSAEPTLIRSVFSIGMFIVLVSVVCFLCYNFVAAVIEKFT